MKKLAYTLLVTVVLSIQGVLAETIFLPAVQDAWIMETEPDAPGLHADRLILNDPSRNTVKTYLLFDGSGLNRIDEVKGLRVWLSSGFSDNRGRVYFLEGKGTTEWDESSITWNSAPLNFRSGSGFMAGRGDEIHFLGFLEPGPAGEAIIEFDSDSDGARALARALSKGDRAATIVLDAEGGNEQINLHSRTADPDGGVAPKLEVEGR